MKRFYDDPICERMFQEFIKVVLERRNVFTQVQYKDDPTIFSWEVTNEPQQPSFAWVDSVAKYIKSLDNQHLVTAGLEGKEEDGGLIFQEAHRSSAIDYCTVHLWVRGGQVIQHLPAASGLVTLLTRIQAGLYRNLESIKL
eukprot:jgi/Mesen1/10511/ME000083S10025